MNVAESVFMELLLVDSAPGGPSRSDLPGEFY